MPLLNLEGERSLTVLFVVSTRARHRLFKKLDAYSQNCMVDIKYNLNLLNLSHWKPNSDYTQLKWEIIFYFSFEIPRLVVQEARIFLNIHHYILGKNNKWGS